jgi:hypothetical protein
MQITHADALSITPKLYRKHTTRERAASGHGISYERSRSSNIPWWEVIQLKREWAEVLMWPAWGWDWFGHLTFREPIHPEAADKVFGRWVHRINRKVFGSRWWQRPDRDGVLWARGLEMQKREVIHYHFLMSRVPGDLGRFEMMKSWEDMAGWARIYAYEAAKGGETYVVKYAAKGGEIEIGGPVHLVKKRHG